MNNLLLLRILLFISSFECILQFANYHLHLDTAEDSIAYFIVRLKQTIASLAITEWHFFTKVALHIRVDIIPVAALLRINMLKITTDTKRVVIVFHFAWVIHLDARFINAKCVRPI